MKFFWTAFVCLFIFACSNKDNGDNYTYQGTIFKIESLGSISLGQSDTIAVYFSGGSNGCASAGHLETYILGDSIYFKAYYNYPKEAQICPMIAPTFILTYIFTPNSVGNYTYKSSNTEEKSITVVN